LGDGTALAIWSIPPSTQVLAQALAIARPQSVYLFAVDPGLDEFRPFTRRLAGLVKHALAAYHGQLEWDSLAAAMAHRVAAVQTGVEWLAATGQLSMLSTGPEQAVVEARGESDPETARALETKLMSMLEETAAYRRYYREADADRLVSLGG
jgi:hypothetical protein